MTHGKACGVVRHEQNGPIAHRRDGRMQMVGLAGKSHELIASGGEVAPACRNAAFRAPASGRRRPRDGQARRPPLPSRARGVPPTAAGPAAPPPASTARSSSSGTHDLDRDAGSLQHGAARRAAGREHQRAAARHSGIGQSRRQPAPIGEQRHDGGRGFLDRTPRHVDQRPIMLGAKPARERDLLSDRMAIDILVVVADAP